MIKRFIILSAHFFFAGCDHHHEKDPDPGKGGHDATAGQASIQYQFTDSIEALRAQLGNQGVSFLYANNGRYFDALRSFDRDFPAVTQDVFYDSLNYHFYPAIDHIVREAAQRQIVIINEAHHVPGHRFFTRLLIGELRKIGFSYFGAETLVAEDSLLMRRGYPVLKTGFYTVEPQYGNLIREALVQGYTLFAYEAGAGLNGTAREREQASNIQKVLAKDPGARMVIHCGYGHIAEDEVEGWGRAMAGRLTEYTNIDPLTIDQVELTEHSAAGYENPYYRKMNFADYVVPVRSGRMITGSLRPDGHPSDLFVYHPRTRLQYARPHWLFSVYKPWIVNSSIHVAFPVIVKVYLAEEDLQTAVPVDVMEIRQVTDTTAMALLPGKRYRVTVRNEKGQRQTIDLDF